MVRVTAIFFLFFLMACKQTDYLYLLPPSSTLPSGTFDKTYHTQDIKIHDEIDIIWVFDNSGSMEIYHKLVEQNASDFIEQFTSRTQLKWRMGILSSDVDDAPKTGFTEATRLDYQSKEPVKQFQEAVHKLGTGGSGTEKAFDPIMGAILRNSDFLRSDAYLALIMVTDAEEQSSVYPVKAFVDQLRFYKGDLKKIVSYGIFSAIDFNCRSEDDRPLTFSGSIYEQFIKLTIGKTYALCDRNFGAMLADLGKDLVTRHPLLPRLYLDARPHPSTIKVEYLGREIPGGEDRDGGFWLYDPDLNSLIFHDVSFINPERSSELNVKFEVNYQN